MRRLMHNLAIVLLSAACAVAAERPQVFLRVTVEKVEPAEPVSVGVSVFRAITRRWPSSARRGMVAAGISPWAGTILCPGRNWERSTGWPPDNQRAGSRSRT